MLAPGAPCRAARAIRGLERRLIAASSPVSLINTALADNTTSNKDVPGNTLTGVFFSVAGSPTLTPSSASVASGAIVQGGNCDAVVGGCTASTTNVGGEFFYGAGSWPGGASYGIASSGYVGGAGNFGGPNLDDPVAVDGINFGIISPNVLDFFPNGGLASEPLIRDRVVFVLSSPTDIGAIGNVSFQYGTSLSEPNIPSRRPNDVPVPEPGVLALLGLGLAALGTYRRRGTRS